MQSQQKKVKWSRGETASALEERTDTGITEVSVARMINCMTDIYGNISRRPALQPIPLADRFQTEQYITLPKMYYSDVFIPFYISEDDFILLAIGATGIAGYRIKNNVIVSASSHSGTSANIDIKSIKYAQQNNYMVVTSKTGDMKITINIIDETTFSISDEIWVFTAGWYAPNGTQTKAVSILSAIWNKDKLGFTSYTYTEKNGQSTVWSYIDSGLTTPDQAREIEQQIPAGSIIQFPNNGAYMRFEGISGSGSSGAYPWYYQDKTFSGGLRWSDSVPSTGTYIKAEIIYGGPTPQTTVKIYENGTNTITQVIKNPFIMVATSSGFIKWDWLTLDGSEGTWSTVKDAKIGIYGPLLTPAAASDKTDTIVNVEYGYINLTPETGEHFPSPAVVTFSGQRLWTAGWKIESASDQYALVIGSQIAKYTDFKNDYNLANEAITLDILTKYREDVLHLIDYNGLKIFTTGAEWAYVDGAPVKQSTNGSLAGCEPIVFGSLCLYADQTGNQIRAMQYELQNNIFDSTIINQMTPGDLIWQPVAMAQYEDKANNTGRHLFVLNQEGTNSPRIATSNFVPGNQAAIWSRWEFQTLDNVEAVLDIDVSLVANIVNTKKQPIFMVFTKEYAGSGLCCMPAILDFEAEADMLVPLDSSNKYRIYYKDGWWERFIPKATVAVYSDGVYQYETTTDQNGVLARVPTGLTNVTVGMPINARVVSHPIDVGGKTKTITKRIAKAVMSVRNTEPGAVTINSKTGYMNPAKDTINFYGVTGMKRETIYTITNNKGAKFTIESLTMNIEYGTLIS